MKTQILLEIDDSEEIVANWDNTFSHAFGPLGRHDNRYGLCGYKWRGEPLGPTPTRTPCPICLALCDLKPNAKADTRHE
jgi:hypothetical protein